MLESVAALGALAQRLAGDAGGITLVFGRTVRRMVPPRLDGDELRRAMVAFGEASLPVVAATAVFTGMIMVVQGAAYVERFGVYDLVGWYTGFSTFREVGPILVGLMISGRVGASNTSELASMAVTEQIDALRILALDPYEVLILPRTVALVVATTALVIFGDLVAVLAGALCARLLLGLDYQAYFLSLTSRLNPEDFLIGVQKAAVFGLIIAIVSSFYGLNARGGSRGVGRAVNAQVVASAVALFVADYLMTSVTR